MQLKALIKNIAKKKNLPTQAVMQNYLMERLLERISFTRYKNNFIVKGGFLIASIVGIETRSTMDLDIAIKGFDLTHKSIKEAFEEICLIKIDDNINFLVKEITNIREGAEYSGIRVSLIANYPPMKIHLAVDVTTGDKISPKEIKYSFPLLFENRCISIMAYNLETIFAEKLETILSRNISNTRPRDFYDIYILYILRWHECNLMVLKRALKETANQRGSSSILQNFEKIITSIKYNNRMNDFWLNYQKDFDYAQNVTFENICDVILNIFQLLRLN